ncbi:hypothetical protein ACFYO2_26480 [Streptomyces sp. NPDC006602]|uniref:hypothetical protein n=1 Tax=Streptomyces sp. NPDC006602 TaxID=3364751 RepID=UPI0036B2D04A
MSRHPRIVLESTLSREPEVLFYMLRGGVLISDDDRYFSRERAIAEVERRNVTDPGHTCVGIPSRLTACEGCENHLVDVIFDADARHLTNITWKLCARHEEDSYACYSAEY